MPAAPELTLELLARRIRKLQQSGAIALILAAISLGLALQTYYRGLSLTEFAKRDDKTQTIRTDTINTRNLNIYNDGGKRVASFGAADLTPRISLTSRLRLTSEGVPADTPADAEGVV